MAAGVPDDLFWACTPAEVNALLDAIAERESRSERVAALLAGLPTSAILNVNRQKKTDKVWKPSDFLVQPRRERSAEDVIAQIRAFAKAHNERRRRQRGEA